MRPKWPRMRASKARRLASHRLGGSTQPPPGNHQPPSGRGQPRSPKLPRCSRSADVRTAVAASRPLAAAAFRARVARQVQHAAGIPARGAATCRERFEVAAAVQAACPGEAGEAVVVEAWQRPQHAGEVARGALARPLGAVDDVDFPAARGEPVGARAAGKAGADHQRVFFARDFPAA